MRMGDEKSMILDLQVHDSYQLICTGNLLENLRQQPLGLHDGVLLVQVEQHKRVVVCTRETSRQSQDALFQIGHRRQTTQLFK